MGESAQSKIDVRTKMTTINRHRRPFFSSTTKEQAKDAGMILALICLIIHYYKHSPYLYIAAFTVLAVNLIVSSVFKPAAWVLLNVSNLLARLTSPIILFIIYICLVLPVGVFRQLMRFDTLSLNEWKKNNLSVFKVREHSYEPKDIDDPY